MAKKTPKGIEKSETTTRLSEIEKEYIRKNCITKTDDEIATAIGRDLRTVVRFRKALGINKKQGGKVNLKTSAGVDLPSHNTSIEFSQLLKTEEEKKTWFQLQFKSSGYYRELKRQLTPEEMELYLEEWGALCTQFEDVVATEKRQIDELIKATILHNRLLRHIRVTEDEIELLARRIEANRKKHKMEEDEVARATDDMMMEMVRAMASQASAMADLHHKFIDTKNKILEQLNARRRDRIEQIRSSRRSYIGLVEALQDSQIREAQAKRMELMKLAKEKKARSWRKPTTFPDGSRSPIILDHQTIAEAAEGAYAATGVEGVKTKVHDIVADLEGKKKLEKEAAVSEMVQEIDESLAGTELS
jgi:hypothetical protein